MSAASVPSEKPLPSSVSPRRLQQIADVLGVSADFFNTPAQSHILHTSENGTRWLLTIDTQGLPVVRGTCGLAAGQRTTEESISSFLTRGAGTPQHEALVALIDYLLAMHLTR